jgi:hypothetical protein
MPHLMLTRVSTHALVSPLAHHPRRPPSSRRRARPLRAKLLARARALELSSAASLASRNPDPPRRVFSGKSASLFFFDASKSRPRARADRARSRSTPSAAAMTPTDPNGADAPGVKKSAKIWWTLTDEAPALATHAFLPVVRRFCGAVGVSVESADISLAARVLAAFPERLTPAQRRTDVLAKLGELATTERANIVKLPNVSASVPQVRPVQNFVFHPSLHRCQHLIAWVPFN